MTNNEIIELLEQLSKKLDFDINMALWDQRDNLRELYDERILALDEESLKVEQELIKAKRELKENVSNKMIGLESIIKETK